MNSIRNEYLPFGRDIVIKQLIVKKWAGRTLRELDLTNQHGLQVVALKETGSDDYVFIPRADLRLKEDDTLVAIGRTDTLDKISP